MRCTRKCLEMMHTCLTPVVLYLTSTMRISRQFTVFGNGGKDRIRTCEFHYLQTVQRHARYLDSISGEEMLKSSSRTELEMVCAHVCFL